MKMYDAVPLGIAERVPWLYHQKEPVIVQRVQQHIDRALVEEKKEMKEGKRGDRRVGSGATTGGMMNTDIDNVMKPYRPAYLGTIARDDWGSLTPAMHKGKSGWIMNTDRLGKPGTHWVAFLLDLDRYTIEYYNSFADAIPDDVLVSLKAFLEVNNPTKHYLKLKENRVKDQDADSTNCGWFSCKFLIDRFRGRPWREVTKFDDHVKGEDAIAKFKQQHGGEYSYL